MYANYGLSGDNLEGDGIHEKEEALVNFFPFSRAW